MPRMIQESNRLGGVRFAGVALGVLSFIVYFVTLSVGAFPGRSVQLIVQHTGLFPKFSPSSPVWSAIVALLSNPFSGCVFRLNLFSAICGSLCVWLLYELMSRTILACVDTEETSKPEAGIAARLAGIFASLALAFSIPFWIVSNRADNASFDILLLLGVTWLFSLYVRTGRIRYALIFAFLYGIGIVELATFIVLAPIFGCYLLFFMWQKEQLNARHVVKLVLCVLAGLMLYFIVAWQFCGSEGYQLRNYKGYFNVIWFTWRDQYFLILRGLPKEGWLIVLFIAVAPWLTCLMVAKTALNEEKDVTYYLLHAVLSVLAVCILLNLKFAPWPMLGAGRLLVTPYVLNAMVFGYLIAYWFLLPAMWFRDHESGAGLFMKRYAGWLIVCIASVFMGIVFLRNLPESDARPARYVNQYADAIVGNLPEDCSWLITDAGDMDSHIMISLKKTGKNVRLLNLRGGFSEIYMKRVAGFFDQIRLKNLARIGMIPLLQEWLDFDPDAYKNVAVLATPDLWVATHHIVVPCKLVFTGAKKANEINPLKLWNEHVSFWAKTVPLIQQMGDKPEYVSDFKKELLRHISMVANNLGVLMEDLRQDSANDSEKQTLAKLAFQAYAKAREINPDNISALLNEVNMIDNGYQATDEKNIRNDLKKLSENMPAGIDMWSLSYRQGYIRMPDAFVQLGWTWALSGQPGLAFTGLKKAMALMPDGEKGHIKQRLADMYFMQKEDDESEALYYELLVEDPQNQQALLGSARVACRKGDFQRAGELLKRAETAGVDPSQMVFEKALLSLCEGNTKQARVELEKLVEKNPAFVKGWTLLADVYVAEGELDEARKCAGKLKEIEEGSLIARVILGQVAIIERDFDSARIHFEDAFGRDPNNILVLERLLRLDVAQVRQSEARIRALRILRLDQANAFANYVMATLQMLDGERDLAEDSFRKSLKTQKTPLALNDLSWLLLKKESYNEAESLARAALAMDEKMDTAWDTLGVILMNTKRFAESEQAFERSLAIYQDNPSVFLHMGELQLSMKNSKRAKEFLEIAGEKQSGLTQDDKKKLDSLMEQAQ